VQKRRERRAEEKAARRSFLLERKGWQKTLKKVELRDDEIPIGSTSNYAAHRALAGLESWVLREQTRL
jgi:hypothetical protein